MANGFKEDLAPNVMSVYQFLYVKQHTCEENAILYFSPATIMEETGLSHGKVWAAIYVLLEEDLIDSDVEGQFAVGLGWRF